MGIVIDIFVVLGVLLSAYLGYKKGLVKLAVHIVAFIITIVAVGILYKPVGNFIIKNTTIDDKLQTTIEENIDKTIKTEDTNKITNSLIESAKKGVLPDASRVVANNIIYGVSMLVLFIIIRIALIFVTALADFIAKLPILNQFNKLGGTIYGLLRGLVIMYVFLMIINIAISFNPAGTIGKAVESSYLTKDLLTYELLK
ncbi:MAG: CvpA family protein [Clostridia bacterium]|nr:CvpA family protein [Clostridia bacterium]